MILDILSVNLAALEAELNEAVITNPVFIFAISASQVEESDQSEEEDDDEEEEELPAFKPAKKKTQ